MEFITATVTIPDFVYRIYEDAAKAIGNHPTERIMASVLIAYVGNLSDEMRQDGTLPDTSSGLRIVSRNSLSPAENPPDPDLCKDTPAASRSPSSAGWRDGR